MTQPLIKEISPKEEKNPEEIAVSKTEIPEREKVNRAEKPIQKELKSSFNLKNLFEKVEEEKPVLENLEDKPKSDFSEDTLAKLWDEFVENLRKENKIPAYNALHTGKVQLKENFQIQFEFTSSSLANEFELEKDNLMRYLREKLNNYAIEFFVVIKEDQTKTFVKTNLEKFKDMAEKNPILLKMKDQFGLDYNSNE